MSNQDSQDSRDGHDGPVGMISRAAALASHLHRFQRRRNSGASYVVHLAGVAELVSRFTSDHEVICAAWLHDSLEDTSLKPNDLIDGFTHRVYRLVQAVTDRKWKAKRSVRKAETRERIRGSEWGAQLIKCCDIAHNAATLCHEEADFFLGTYLYEAVLLAKALRSTDHPIIQRALDMLDECLDDAHRMASATRDFDWRRTTGTRVPMPEGLKSMTLEEIVKAAYTTAVAKGWEEDYLAHAELMDKPEGAGVRSAFFGAAIALIQSESAEALEAYRSHGLDRYKSEGGKPEGVGSELADVVIRIGHLCGRLGIDLEYEVAAKMEYNRSRPHRHGGKKL